MSWFAGGDEEISGGSVEFADSNSTWRFWLKEDAGALIQVCDRKVVPLTIDGETRTIPFPFKVKEHSLKIDGKYGQTFTCLGPMEEATGEKCPLCLEGEDRPATVVAMTVRMWSSYQKDGQTQRIVGAKRLLVLKASSATWEMLKSVMADSDDGSLFNKFFEVKRTKSKNQNKKTPSVGDVWLPVQKPERKISDEASIAIPDDFECVDYAEVFAPKSRAALLSIIGAGGGKSGRSNDSGKGSDDDRVTGFKNDPVQY